MHVAAEMFTDPLRLQLRRAPAGRRDAARRRLTPTDEPADGRAPGQPRRSCRARHLGHTPHGLDGGRAQPLRTDRRRAGGAARGRSTGWRCDHGFLRQQLVRGPALGITLWLLTGGTLSLHQPFDPSVFAAQCRAGSLRHRGPSRRAGVADRPGRTARPSRTAPHPRALARAGTALGSPRRGAITRRTWSTCWCSAKPA